MNEEIEALGFEGIEQYEQHQEWLGRMQAHKLECVEAVSDAGENGVIDLRKALAAYEGKSV